MEYILNKTNTPTTVHSKINDIHLDLDIPKLGYSKFIIEGSSYEEYVKRFESRIGFSLDQAKEININVKNDIFISTKMINDSVETINLNVYDTVKSNITILFESEKDIYHMSKICSMLGTNSKVVLNVISKISKSSKSFISFENELKDFSNLEINFIDFGGDVKVNNYHSNVTGKNAICKFNNIYMAHKNDIVDMNYYTGISNVKSEGYINVYGILNDEAKKSFKGTIDFIKGSTSSVGKELEKVILLSDNCITKSLPILLCHEDDVEGAHGVSTGKLDEEMIFYMMSKGISLKDAKKLTIRSSFDIALNKLDSKLYDDLVSMIDNYI